MKWLFAGALVAAWVAVIGAVAAAELGYHPLSPSVGARTAARALAPEGWAFFTRDPQEAVKRLFQRDPSGDWRLVPTANFARANWFGLKRRNRLYDAAVSMLLAGTPATDWRPCRDTIAACLAAGPVPVRAVSADSLAERLLQGDYVVQIVEKTPWAWAASRPAMPSQILRLRVE